MTEVGLFIAGGAVTLIVFVGVLIYGMLSFSKWSKGDEGSNARA
jgi:hypothetical protein